MSIYLSIYLLRQRCNLMANYSDYYATYTWREVTPQTMWSRYDRHFVGITWHNVWS